METNVSLHTAWKNCAMFHDIPSTKQPNAIHTGLSAVVHTAIVVDFYTMNPIKTTSAATAAAAAAAQVH